MNNNTKQIGLLNFEGDVFKVIKNGKLFDIIDFKGINVRETVSPSAVLSIYDGLENIKTSEGRLYDISKEHPDAKPSRDTLIKFLGLAKSYGLNRAINITLSDKQQAEFDEWKEAIKKIYGEYGYFDWIITPFGMGTGIKVKSHLTGTTLDISHEEDW
jgi:hypothetical protein